jgi:PAS domain S-box-containing protein
VTAARAIDALIVAAVPADADWMVTALRRAAFTPRWRRVATEPEFVDRLTSDLDVILADSRLPSFGAGRALEILKTRDLDIPFIVVSGPIDEEIAVSYLEQGAVECLGKDRLGRLGPAVARALAQRRLREALRTAEAALHESEKRYRLIAENVSDGIFLIDAEGCLVFGNRSLEEIAGFTMAESLGRPIFSLLTRDAAVAAMARLARAQAGESVPRAFETEIVRKDGSTVWVEAHITSVMKDGRMTGRLGVVRDISGRKRAEEALRQSEKLAAISSLAAGVAHELNNPLTIITGRTELLHRQLKDDPLGLQVEKLAQAATRCTRIVRNFLALARPHPPERQPTSLNGIVRDVLELLAYPLRVDNVDVTFDLAPDLPTLWADPHQLHQVAVNLITNAHQAMRDAPLPRRLTLASRSEGGRGWVVLEVADTGPGIILSAEGHHVETAEHGAVALEKLRGGHYDLIMSDVRMPELDGPGLYRELQRRHPRLCRRIVFLTGDVLGPCRTELVGTTAPTLSKPFALGEIRRVIETVLHPEPPAPAREGEPHQ